MHYIFIIFISIINFSSIQDPSLKHFRVKLASLIKLINILNSLLSAAEASYVQYLNGELQDGAEYGFFQRSFDKNHNYESLQIVTFKTEKKFPVAIVVSVIVVILVIGLLLVGAVFFYIRRRRSSSSDDDNEIQLREQKAGPIRRLTNRFRAERPGSGGLGKSPQ